MRIPTALLSCAVLLLVACYAQEARPRSERARVSRVETAPRTACSIQLFNRAGSRRRPSSVVTTVECGDETLFDEEVSFDDLQETTLSHGITLFAETSFGFAYVLLDGTNDINLVQSRFSELTQAGSRDMAAPLVILDANLDITNITFDENRGGFRSGAAILGGTSNVDFLNATFVENEGEEGVLVVTDSSRFDVELSIFLRNDGGEVGALKISRSAIGLISECVFEANIGERFANEFYITGTATGIIDESLIYGEEAESDFDAFLRDATLPENTAENFTMPDAAVAAVTNRATVLFSDTLVSGHVGRFGAIYITDSTIFSALRTNFVNNRAITGGGLYANSNRAGFARVLESNFTNNLARNGGGLVFAGNGTYTIDTCHFENNTALNGGAIWGDYSESNTCPRASAGSRITLLNTTFAKNTAQRDGGAFYIQCTDIFADTCEFRENVAMNGDGGFIYAKNTHDLRFVNCSITQNRAGSPSLAELSSFKEGSRCDWLNNTAGEDGGTIATLNGHGIIFSESILHNSASGRHGGAIRATNLTMVDFRETSTVQNQAGGRGGVFSGKAVSEFRWQDVTTERNTASSSGAIYVDGGDVFEIKEMQFLNHTASDGAAGAIWLNGVQNVSFQDVDFLQNSATKRCGALSVAAVSNLEITNAVLEMNRGSSGGSLCVEAATRANLTALRLYSNLAEDGDGGAVLIRDGGNLTLSDLIFMENSASQSGGALFLANAGNLSLLHSVIESNQAEGGDGGALAVLGSDSLAFTNLTVLNHRAALSGGAFYVTDGGDVAIRDTLIESNRAQGGDGGAVSVLTSRSLALADLTVMNNRATQSGGAFYVTDGGAIEILDSLVEANLAEDGSGGGVSLTRGRSLLLTNITLHNNNASQVGGALALEELGSASIVASTVMNSSAPESGGCLQAHSVREFTLRESAFSHCLSRAGGAAIFTGSAEITARDMIFELNAADDGGGAFFCRHQTKIDVDSSRFYHNSAPDGSTLNADCNCEVEIRDSKIYRDEDRPDNGDFFEVNSGCSELFAFGNEFFGGPESNSALEWYDWTGIAAGAVGGILLLCCCCYCWKKRKAAAARAKKPETTKSDLEDPATEDEDSDDESDVTESTEEESYDEASEEERR